MVELKVVDGTPLGSDVFVDGEVVITVGSNDSTGESVGFRDGSTEGPRDG